MKIQWIDCWNKIHMNFCLLVEFYLNFLSCFIITSFIVFIFNLEKRYPTFLLHWRIILHCFFLNILHDILLEENQRESNKWKCFCKISNNNPELHFKMESESIRFKILKWNNKKYSQKQFVQKTFSSKNSENSNKSIK